MKNISLWAKSNARAAQFLIVVGHILAIYLSIQVGILLLTIGIESPKGLAFVLLELFILTVWLYPSKKALGSSTEYYERRRYFDGALLGLSALLTVVCANRMTSEALDSVVSLSENARINVAPTSKTATFIVYQSEKSLNLGINNNSISIEKQGKHHNWLQKRLVKKYQSFASEEKSNGSKTALMILLILGILVVDYGLVALSCSIACNGMEAVAAIILVGGVVGLSALISLALRHIFPDMAKKKRIISAIALSVGPILLALLLASL